MCSMHEVDRGVYYNRYVYYDMGMLAWHAAVQRYPRLAIGRLGGSRARRILDGLPTEMVASPCHTMLPGRGYGRCNIIMGQEDDMTGVTLQRAYGHSIPVFICGLAGDEESAPSFGHLRILPADLSELGSGLRVDRRRALLCGHCACDGRSERRRSLVRVARPSGWDLANPYIRERMSARALGILSLIHI